MSWDIALTVLHPAARGPLSYRANRWTWGVVRRVSFRFGGRRLLSYAGPLAMGVNVVGWVTGLWLGFALIYLTAESLYGALYVSGEALTTVGFGDQVAGTRVLRMIASVEAGAGLGAFTAAIAYVLSVYPLVTEVRADALHLADLEMDEPAGAARVVALAGEVELSAQLRALTKGHEHVRRFPILYYFESGDEDETLTTLLRSGCATCLILGWGFDHARLPAAAIYAPAFEQSLDRLLTDLENDWIGGRARRFEPPGELPPHAARDALGAIRAAVRATSPELVAEGDEGLDHLDRFLARAEAVLAAFAREHGQRAASLTG